MSIASKFFAGVFLGLVGVACVAISLHNTMWQVAVLPPLLTGCILVALIMLDDR